MRELERTHGVTWRTVWKALDSAWPEPRKKLPPRAAVLDPYKPVIDEILRADLDAPRKQRRTVTWIFHRLVEEHGAEGSYGTVRYYVAARKPEILAESGRAPREVFVPQTHQPGHEAEVDFGDVTVCLGGELVTCYLFSFRLPYSGKAVHRVFASCGPGRGRPRLTAPGAPGCPRVNRDGGMPKVRVKAAVNAAGEA